MNFTKNRVDIEEIQKVLQSPQYQCGVIRVKDNYGNYGLTGFYCIDINRNTLVHFCFSCRIMGMGVEQYVYQQLGHPVLNIIGEVSGNPLIPENPYWINFNTEISIETLTGLDDGKNRILLKGPCDLCSVANFFNANNITTEFTYTNKKNNASDYGLNHTIQIVNSFTLSIDVQQELDRTLPFIGEETFSKKCLVLKIK